MELRFYYDVVCPYAYLASTRVEALAAQYGATLRWIPILLGGLLREVGAATDPNALMSPPRMRMNLLDMHRWASLWGVPLEMPAEHPRRTVAAMRLLVGLDDDDPVRVALTHALYRAYWIEGRDLSDRSVLDGLARAHGVDPGIIDSPRARARLFETTAEAAAAGAFGVPAFVIAGDGDDQDRCSLIWGQDRLHLVAAALGAAGPARILPDPAPSGATDAPATGGARVRFFHDFASPFSYLAATQIQALADRHGATLEWVPILLGALFREIGTADVPLHTMAPVKQDYVNRDLHDWAALWGVPFRFPAHFPLRTVKPLRVALAEPAVTLPLYRAAWADDRPIDDPDVLRDVLAAAGFDADHLLQRTADPELKAALRRNTAIAKDIGACGVPTIEVTPPGGQPMLFWGQDRLELAAAAMAGRLPDGFPA